MKISLSKDSDVPLRQQLAEQIVFLITTGQLREGQPLPSVRALARRAGVHHNTVSEAYQELVRRNWVTGHRGGRLTVALQAPASQEPRTLDELINESIERAKQMGYSLQALTECVRERLLAEPADHFLVVEDEPGLREIIRREIEEAVGRPAQGCAPDEFARESDLAVGAQIVGADHVVKALKKHIPQNRPASSITYSGADGHLNLIRRLNRPSIVAVVSVSQQLLKTAESLLAPEIERRHTFRGFLLSPGERIQLRGVDLAFCDSVAMPTVQCRRKVRYQLIHRDCLEGLVRSVGRGVARKTHKISLTNK